jgi:hypothetical protein
VAIFSSKSKKEGLTAEERRADKHKTMMMDYKRVFGSEQGRRVLSDLIANHFVMNSTYSRGPQAELDMAFKEGQRQVVMRLMTIMKYDPEQTAQAIKESDDYVRKI